VRLGLSEIGSVARASHLLDWAVFYRFGFRLLVRSLVPRTLLEWAFIVLSVTKYYLLVPSLTGYLVLFESSNSEIDI
jgi:hypothetical protein